MRYLWHVGHARVINAPCDGCPHGYAPSLETAIDQARFALQKDYNAPDAVRHDVGFVRLDARVIATVGADPKVAARYPNAVTV